jgi:HTH-type transcriptional regulator/antitoxin HipB
MRIASTSDIAAIVRGRRQELGLSQGEVALRAGVSRRWLVGFEGAGSTHAELGTTLRVLDALDLRLDAHAQSGAFGTDTHHDVLADDPGSVDLDAILDELRRG